MNAAAWHRGLSASRPPASGAPAILSYQFYLVQLSVLLLPVNWFLGTTIPWLLGVAGFLSLGMARLAWPEWALLCLGAVLSLSLGLAMIAEFDAWRGMAATYNITVVLAMVAFLNWGRQIDEAERAGIARWPKEMFLRAALVAHLANVLYMYGAWTYVVATGNSVIAFKAAILGRLGNFPGIVGLYAENTVASQDWINNATQLRIHGLGAYATESSVITVGLAMLAAIYLMRKRRPLLALMVELPVLPMLMLIGSRTTGLAYIVSFLFLAVIWRMGLALGIMLVGPLALVALVVFAPDIGGMFQTSFQSLADARAGSTESRVETYQLAIDMVVRQDILLGLGVKPFNEYNPGMPIGSHSSFVSVFTRSGLIGLGMIIVFYLIMVLRLVLVQYALVIGRPAMAAIDRIEFAYLSRLIFVFMTWWVTGDLDAPLFQAFLAATAIGIFWNASSRALGQTAR